MFTSDKYEKMLMGLAFGMLFVSIVISLIGNNIDIAKENPITPEWLVQSVTIFWLIVIFIFGSIVIKRGKKFLKQQKEEELEAQQKLQKQSISPRMVIDYDKVHGEVLEDLRTKSKKGEQKND